MKKYNSKKAVSALIATVLLILVTIAGVAIIAGAVIPMITRINEGSRICTNVQLSVNTQSGFTCYDSQNKLLSVMVARGAGEFELSKVAIIIYGADGNSKKIIRNQSLPGVNSASTYILNASDFSGISRISVSPIVKNGNREKECDISSAITLIPVCAFALKLIEEEQQPPAPQQNCSDGTLYGTCSVTNPKYCNSSGQLINNCSYCGCNSVYGYTCQPDGSCQVQQQDLIPPIIAFTSPTPANGSTIYINSQMINVTSTENVSSCILSWDPPTTISLDYTQDLSDVEYDGGSPGIGFGSQIKWNITAIPAGATINDGTLCMYIYLLVNQGGVDNDITVWYINNQTWDDTDAQYTTLLYEIRAQTKLNETNTTLSSITQSTWSCFSVTTQLQQAYANANQNFTVRFEDPDYYVVGRIATVLNAIGLYIGQYSGAAKNRTQFDDRENSGSSGNRPYLNITYTAAEAGKSIINYTMTAVNKDASTTAYYNVTSLTSGTNYIYWVSCNDAAGNANKTGQLSFSYLSAGSGTETININSSGTYYLSASIINSASIIGINISANNVTLDCQGYTIDGVDNESSYGMYIARSNNINNKNITIKNCYVGDWGKGIYLAVGSPTGSGYNPYLTGNSFYNNVVTSNNYGFYLQSTGDVGTSFLTNNNFINNTASNNIYGFYLFVAYYANLKGNNFTNNIVSNNNYGFYLWTASGTDYSSKSSYMSGNIFTRNTLVNNALGFLLNRTASGGQIIYTHMSGNNFYDNFLNNTQNFNFESITEANNWNTSKIAGTNIINGNWIGGNAWVNPSGTGFSQTCADSNADGICDSSYTLAANNIDYLPLRKI